MTNEKKKIYFIVKFLLFKIAIKQKKKTIIFTFKFCSQNFLLSFPACCSNCDAPCWSASAIKWRRWRLSQTNRFFRIIIQGKKKSTVVIFFFFKLPARSSSSDSFWSRSRTFSTLVFIMSTTSSTCACVCCSRFWDAICWGVLGPPTIPSPPAAAASGARPPSVALKNYFNFFFKYNQNYYFSNRH